MGPILIALCLGVLLLLGGKIHFSDIESSFVMGSIWMYLLFNFMAKITISPPRMKVFPFISS